MPQLSRLSTSACAAVGISAGFFTLSHRQTKSRSGRILRHNSPTPATEAVPSSLVRRTRELESGGIDGWWWEEMWICGGQAPTRLAEAQSVPHVWAESLPTQGGPRGLAGIVKVSCKRM